MSTDPREKVYLPFNCPSCGQALFIRADRLSRLHKCKACEAIFHFRRKTGELKVGKPTNADLDDDYQHHIRGTYVGQSSGEPVSWKMAAVSAFALLVLVGVAGYVVATYSKAKDLPKTLEQRSEYIVQAAIDRRGGDLKGIVERDTLRHAEDWFASVSKSLDAVKIQPGSRSNFEVDVLYRSAQSKNAAVVIHFLGGTGGTKERAKLYTMVLYWGLDPEGDWMLDGTTTFRRSHDQPREKM